MLIPAITLILSYLLGSIPTAIWLSKYVYGADIRTQGSGNAGSTNMFRIYGKKAGIITQVVDIGKGALAAALPRILAGIDLNPLVDTYDLEMQSLVCGLLAVCGHIWPVFARFKGGKGINTLFGMMLVVNPVAAGICMGVFIVVLLLSKYVSLSSMMAVGSYPVFLLISGYINGEMPPPGLVALGFGMFLLVVFTHRENIGRLMKGAENQAGFLKGKK